MSELGEGGQHYALYGQTVMQRTTCPECGDHSLVVGGATLCCGVHVEFSTTESKRMSRSEFIRRQPSTQTKRNLLSKQENRCFYCDRRFGTSIVRHGRLWLLKPTWDHYVPFAYCGSNPAENFVAACQVCNGYKSSMIFQTREEAQLYVQSRWGKEFGPEDAETAHSEPS
jgi:5-methylcytosine-specific restriction endonuclease McrA